MSRLFNRVGNEREAPVKKGSFNSVGEWMLFLYMKSSCIFTNQCSYRPVEKVNIRNTSHAFHTNSPKSWFEQSMTHLVILYHLDDWVTPCKFMHCIAHFRAQDPVKTNLNLISLCNIFSKKGNMLITNVVPQDSITWLINKPTALWELNVESD